MVFSQRALSVEEVKQFFGQCFARFVRRFDSQPNLELTRRAKVNLHIAPADDCAVTYPFNLAFPFRRFHLGLSGGLLLKGFDGRDGVLAVGADRRLGRGPIFPRAGVIG